MRKRLIGLIQEAFMQPKYEFYTGGRNCAKGYVSAETIADYLLDNGVIVLPCKVGDTVYLVCYKPTKCSKHQEYRDEYNCQGCEELYCDSRIEYYIHPIDSVKLDWIVQMEDCIGYTVFLTKEEAEAKLKELKKGGTNET